MVYSLLAGGFWILGLLLVPADRFRRLLPFGLIAGFALAAAINVVGSGILGLWRFGGTGLLTVQGVPLMALLAWVPVVILFAHFLPSTAPWRLAWLLLFPLGFTLLEFGLLRLGVRTFAPNWNLFHAFALSLSVHIVVLAGFLLTAGAEVPLRNR